MQTFPSRVAYILCITYYVLHNKVLFSLTPNTFQLADYKTVNKVWEWAFEVCKAHMVTYDHEIQLVPLYTEYLGFNTVFAKKGTFLSTSAMNKMLFGY